MSRRSFATLAVALALAACDAGLSEPDGSSVSPIANLYLTGALNIMQTNSVRRFEVDWAGLREQAFADAAGAQSSFDTYPAIVAALEHIGDRHSFFRPAGGQAAPTPAIPATTDPSAGVLASGIGYVDVPAFNGGGSEADDLASAYHRLIEGVDTLAQTCRWVVDLRGNTGGNMWPMVAGLGPVLGEGTVGSFFYPDSVATSWFYQDGRAGIEAETITTAAEPYVLESPDPWVAVLTDSLTASSGEAVAVAFRARPGARSFGTPTWGVSTANAGFELSDGAVIFLTVATLQDRAGTVYGGRLDPDEPVAGGAKTGDPSTDAALYAAEEWLLAQPCG